VWPTTSAAVVGVPGVPEAQAPAAPAAPRVWRPSPLTQGDLIFTALFVVMLVGSVVLEPSAQAISIFGYELPTTCLWRGLTGWRCPGCGLTRSFTFMGHLQPVEAFRVHVLGPFLYLAVLILTPLRIAKTIRVWRAWRREAAS
jgi:hypothetical protein